MSTGRASKKMVGEQNLKKAAELVQKHQYFIRKIFATRVKQKHLQDDLFQELFLVMVAKPIPDNVKNTKGWMYKIICDLTKDEFRRTERYQKMLKRYVRRAITRTVEQPESGIIEEEETKKMFELIQRRLTPTEAIAVQLRYRDNYDTREVAVKMGVKARSVSRYVAVGLKKIRHSWGEKMKGNCDDITFPKTV